MKSETCSNADASLILSLSISLALSRATEFNWAITILFLVFFYSRKADINAREKCFSGIFHRLSFFLCCLWWLANAAAFRCASDYIESLANIVFVEVTQRKTETFFYNFLFWIWKTNIFFGCSAHAIERNVLHANELMCAFALAYLRRIIIYGDRENLNVILCWWKMHYSAFGEHIQYRIHSFNRQY